MIHLDDDDDEDHSLLSPGDNPGYVLFQNMKAAINLNGPNVVNS
jgi:hypothetical protein